MIIIAVIIAVLVPVASFPSLIIRSLTSALLPSQESECEALCNNKNHKKKKKAVNKKGGRFPEDRTSAITAVLTEAGDEVRLTAATKGHTNRSRSRRCFESAGQTIPSFVCHLFSWFKRKKGRGGEEDEEEEDGISEERHKLHEVMPEKMSLEPPIVKVIHILTEVQENCSHSVSVAIDKALQILRSPDLYTPPLPTAHLPAPKRQESDADEITTDLFTGLIHSNKPISGIRRMSYEAAVANRQSFSSLREFGPTAAATTAATTSAATVPTASRSLVPSNSCPLPSATNIPDNIKEVLDSQLDWCFDIIRLEQITARQPLVWLGLSILSHFNVCATLNCDEKTLRSWLTMIEANYRDNPYHNSTHAADVMQATAYFLTKPRLEAIFDPLDQAIALIAAICHDIDHPGKTSAFLCNSGSDLAILYNDISVLESHHAALTFKLTLSDPSVNIFKNIDQETFKEVRHSVIDMILATEMTKHFEHLTKFVNVFNKSLALDSDTVSGSASDAGAKGVREAKGKAATTTSGAASSASTSRIRSSSLASPENVVLVKRILIKCADVSNPTRPLHLCIAWGQRIAEEYCNQTDEEKAHGLPVVMPVFDRSTCSIPKSQVRADTCTTELYGLLHTYSHRD